MKVGEFEIPDGLLYTKNHEWLRIEGEKCRTGITDYAQKSLHDIVFVDLPKTNTSIGQGQSLGSVESVKAVADVFAPVSCNVIEVNNMLAEKPELLNQQPYEEGWVAVIQATRFIEEKDSLLDPNTYGEFLKTQIHK